MDRSWSSKTREYFSCHHSAKNDFYHKPPRKINWKRMAQNFRQDLQNYTENTTLHGFRYLSSNEVTVGGKFMWLAVCLVSFSLSIYLMLTVWEKYTITPTVISVESTTHPIWGLRFPAVTICNYNKVYESRAETFATKMKAFGANDSEIKEFFDALPKLIHEEWLLYDFDELLQRINGLEESSEWLMYRLMQPCDKLIVRCSWLGAKHDCTKIFKTVKTADGFCCAFNYHVIGGEFPPDSRGFDTKDQDKWNISTQPGVHEVQMVPGAGRDTGLEVFIDVEAETTRASIRPYAGASILIHDPYIYPEINIQTVVVQPAQEISVIVKGNVIESEDNVRDLSQKRRKCWFQDEVKLNTTTKYSYQSCVTECRMEHIVAHCHCLPFYYPNTMENVKRCDVRDVQCLRSYRGFLSKLQTPFDERLNGTIPRSAVPKCLQCLPQCSTGEYTVETENAVLNNGFHIKHKPSFSTRPQHSVLTVFFPDITCLKYRRATFMTWDNLLASFGGIFGLCIGGSVVSFVEIIYYLMIWLFRRSRVTSFRKPLPVCSHDTNERLERQQFGLMRNIPMSNWQDSTDFERGPNYNYNVHNAIASQPIDFPHRKLNGTTFTIEVSNAKGKFPPHFMRM